MNQEAPGRVELGLGTAHRDQGRFDEARRHLAEAVSIDPELVDAHLQLGLSYLLEGKATESIPHFERVLVLEPKHQLGLMNLGNAHNHSGNHECAFEFYTRTLEAGPAFAMGHNNLASALQSLGRLEDAIDHYVEGLALEPENALLLGNLSCAYAQLGAPEKMLAHCQRLISERPSSLQGLLHLCVALQAAGRHDEAAGVAKQAVAVDVDSAAAHFHLGTSRAQQGLIEDAVICFENALEADPCFDHARNSLACNMNVLGKLDEALVEWERLVKASPRYDVAQSNLALCRHYSPEWNAEALRVEIAAWGRRVEKSVGEPKPFANVRDPDRILRLGYVSGDFAWHPVAMFFESLLGAGDSGSFHVTCYATTAPEDEVTGRLRALSDVWRNVTAKGDEAFEAIVREDGIDLLVDLSGHTGGNRLTAFARRMAPIQITAIGYPGTTGLSRMDYRLVDRWTDPEGSEAHCTEERVRLERCFLSFTVPDNAPAPALDLPQGPGWFDFGSFNNLSKVGPQVIEVWARILRKAPGSRLLMKNASFVHRTVRARVEGMFAAHGVPSGRLELMGRVSHTAHFALFNQVGLHLDAFPYNGTATTCEAAWMGVPTLTLVGDRHSGRVGLSLNTALGLGELCCLTVEQYVARAVELTADHERMRSLRLELRERMSASELCDGAGLARAVEAAYRVMWRRWCAE